MAGEIAELGEGVEGWEVGQCVGVGWFGGNCGWREPCRRGDFIACQNMGIPGVTFDGGYADYLVVKSSALALIPDETSPTRTPRRSSAPASPPTTPCATRAPAAEQLARDLGAHEYIDSTAGDVGEALQNSAAPRWSSRRSRAATPTTESLKVSAPAAS